MARADRAAIAQIRSFVARLIGRRVLAATI
jgi:hypothetical protein